MLIVQSLSTKQSPNPEMFWSKQEILKCQIFKRVKWARQWTFLLTAAFFFLHSKKSFLVLFVYGTLLCFYWSTCITLILFVNNPFSGFKKYSCFIVVLSVSFEFGKHFCPLKKLKLQEAITLCNSINSTYMC